MSNPLDVEEGFGSSTIHGHSQLPSKAPLVYYYGHQSPAENLILYRKYVSRLALAVTSRLDDEIQGFDPTIILLIVLEKYSGCIIDTSGILDQSVGTDMIRDIVAEFSVTVIVVLGHERLYNDMARRFGDRPGMAVVKLARSGGAVEINDSYLDQIQNHITKKYFYGEMKNILSPVSRTLDFKSIRVFRLAQGSTPLSFSETKYHYSKYSNTPISSAHRPRGVYSITGDRTSPARLSSCFATFSTSYYNRWY